MMIFDFGISDWRAVRVPFFIRQQQLSLYFSPSVGDESIDLRLLALSVLRLDLCSP